MKYKCQECGKVIRWMDEEDICQICRAVLHKDCFKQHTHMVENPSLRSLSVITKRGETWQFRSLSNSNKKYTVTLWYQRERLKNGKLLPFEPGYLTCNCPAWVFQKKPLRERTCKHTKEVEKETNPSKIT